MSKLPQEYVLVIDQGTSGTKASIVSSSAEILITHTEPLETRYTPEGYAEQDPEQLYESTIEAVGSVLNQCRQSDLKVTDIRSIGISNQRESFLLWDEDGEPLTNVILWHCKRSIQICERFKEHEPKISEITGLRVDPYFSGTKLRWVLEHEEKVREVYERGEAFFGTVDTWLIYLLTGKKSYTTDQTNASRTLLFDIRHLRWSDELLNLFKVELIQLPEVLSSDSIFGTTDLNRLLPASVPITGVLGDSQAASVGEGLFEAGDTKVTMGTGSSLMVNTVDHVKSSSGLVSTICWSTKDKTSYGLEGIIVSCGSTLTWLIEEMKFVSNVREIDSIAESTCDSSPVSFIPALGGLGAPYWNRKATASFQGLRFGVTKEKMVRAVVESYPFILHDIIMSVKHDLQNADICLKADGGMTNSGITMQLISDILQTEVFVDRRKESSTIGAALFSFLGNGLLTLSQLKDMAKNSKYTVYRPKQNEKLIASYDLWKKRMQSRRSE